MPNQHLVRVGLLGQIGRFSSPSGSLFPRGRRVICRTIRGLEVGMVLQTPATADLEPEEPIEELATKTIVEERSSAAGDGTVLRLVTPEDDLLLARLERNRQDAYMECVKLLSERSASATLVDVEHLFDGSSLYFYFLGEVTPEVDQLTSELASVYEAKVEFRRFAETLQQGCGPDCGTESASGCGTSCSSCVLVGACGTRES